MSRSRTTIFMIMIIILLSACSSIPKWGKSKNDSKSDRTSVSKESSKQQDANKGADQFAAGIARYEEGDYEPAEKNLTAALDLGLSDPADQITAHKYLAFLYCVSGLEALCEMEFNKAFEIDPGFTLSPAETGHPIWQPVYNKAKSQVTPHPKKP